MHKAVLIIVALFAIAVFAQDTSQTQPPTSLNAPAAGTHQRGFGRRGGNIDQRISSLTERFNLTEDQQQKLRPILQDEQSQAQTIRNDSTLSSDQRRQKLMELHKTTRTQMQALLTPEQRAAARKSGGKKAANGQGSAMRGNSMAWLDKRVNLTDDQKAKLKPVFAGQRKQAKAIRQDASLTPEQKGEKLRALHLQTRKDVLAVLTPEQQQQLRESRPAKPQAAPGSGQ